MSIIRYPAVFHKEEGGYWAEFPDLPGCYTQGDTIECTYQSATEALGLYLDKEGESGDRRISKPSRIDYILQNNKNDFVMLVTFDSLEYARRYKTKAVKKNAFHSGVAERSGSEGGCEFLADTSGSADRQTR